MQVINECTIVMLSHDFKVVAGKHVSAWMPISYLGEFIMAWRDDKLKGSFGIGTVLAKDAKITLEIRHA